MERGPILLVLKERQGYTKNHGVIIPKEWLGLRDGRKPVLKYLGLRGEGSLSTRTGT